MNPTIPPHAIRDELERVVAGSLTTAPQLARFLRFVVDETLAGRGAQLKGYTIAVQAMGREPSFDAGADAAVRVAARQLRYKLTEYYAPGGDGEHHELHIALPKGGYVPEFIVASPVVASAQPASTVATVPSTAPTTSRAMTPFTS